jgi:hypothetical protein
MTLTVIEGTHGWDVVDRTGTLVASFETNSLA